MKSYLFILSLLLVLTMSVIGYAPLEAGAILRAERLVTASRRFMTQANGSEGEDQDIIARRIVVTGDVQGGYYRSCVLNEAGRFRRLVGTMTPPDDTDTAEIYVEGKRKMVEGFVRWVKRGDVGLSQKANVKEVTEEDPTGLYDGFYVKTR
jgi:acylphosphatase